MDQEQKVVSSSKQKNNKLNISLDFRVLCVVLLLVIAVMLAIWQPWNAQSTNSSRTISVTGDSTLKAVPDEYVFNPQYEFKDADKAAALAGLTPKQAEVVAGLKKLGVADNQIKADTNGYSNSYFDETAGLYHYSISLQVTVADKALVQKVQDYLLTTEPTGSVSPQASFSDATRKKLESQGRDAATKEARAKADQSAKNLGFKVGAVKSVTDSGNGNGDAFPMYSTLEAGSASDTKQSLSVLPGQDELTYSVTVVYYVK
jgi:uncharacterized protein YggE